MIALSGIRVRHRLSWWVRPLIWGCKWANRFGLPVTADATADFIGRHGIHVEGPR